MKRLFKRTCEELVCPCWTAPKSNLCQRHFSKRNEDYLLSVGEPFVNKRTSLSVPSSNHPPNSRKYRDLKLPLKKVFVNRIKRSSERKDHEKN